LKTKFLSFAGYIIVAVVLVSFTDPFTIKRITDKEFKYEFYTTKKQPKTKTGRQYFWFRGGAIHNAQSGFAGELLHDKFIKMYLSNQIAEQGIFDNGLKTGLWKNWYPDGTLQSEQYWNDGLKDGEWHAYDQSGALIEKGRFKNDLKDNRWINYQKKDTVVYENGAVFVKKPKLSKEEKAALKSQKKAADAKKSIDTNKKPNFFGRLFSKKNAEKTAKDKQPDSDKPAKSIDKKATDKPDFFQRLFSKKPDKSATQ